MGVRGICRYESAKDLVVKETQALQVVQTLRQTETDRVDSE